MALTREFRKTVADRLDRDPQYAAALLAEGVQSLLDGDTATGKAILRDYINGTIGFEKLAERTGGNAKSLMRMFSPGGNPQAAKLFPVIAALQAETGRELAVTAR